MMESITEESEGFSFAYLKELFAASLMRFAAQTERPFASVVREELAALRAQMQSSILSDVETSTVPTERDPFAMARWQRRFR
jgi:hypothetical protein